MAPLPLPPAPASVAQPLPPPPAANYPNWNAPAQLPNGLPPAQAMFERPGSQRPSAQLASAARRSPLKPWMVVIGALVMAFLAFAVTRACIHAAATRAASEPR
jgi:hypothetical protein